MVQLIDSDIQTREVLGWQGIHLFHARMSSCSQKLRIFLRLKGIEWESHELNLSKGESYTEWFLGINPRGLVPVLVWDGVVHIESNDIMALLDQCFGPPELLPERHGAKILKVLEAEDALHLDLRTLSFRFLYNRTGSPKTSEMMEIYRAGGSGMVAGKEDTDKRGLEIAFYEGLAREGLTDETVRRSAAKFLEEFDRLEQRLGEGSFLLGDTLTVVDIAWFVYATRLELGGFPFRRLYPKVAEWRTRLGDQSEFADEVRLTSALAAAVAENRREQERTGTTVSDIVGI